jgi:hypothetical protein
MREPSKHRSTRLFVTIGAGVCALFLSARAAHATGLTVSSGCTVAEAVTSFNDEASTPGTPPQPGCTFVNDGSLTRTITVPAGTYTFSSINPRVSMTIVGAGIDTTTFATTGTNGIVVTGSIRPNPTLTLRTLTVRKSTSTSAATSGILVNCLPGPAHLFLDRARIANYTQNGVRVESVPDGQYQVGVEIIGSTIEGNTLSGVVALDASVFVSNSTIRTNLAGGLRATFTSEFGRVAVLNSTFNDNQASQGGALFVDDTVALGTDRVAVVGSTIRNNKATSGSGGGLQLLTAQTSIEGTVIRDNTATADGGGLSASGSLSLYLKEVTVTGNQAVNGGGVAVRQNGGQPFSNIERSLFANNTATGNGGGIYHYGQISTLNNSTIDNNRAANGGGLYIDPASGGESHMSSTTITRNQASVKAGGVHFIPNTPIFSGNLITTNTAPASPDVFMSPDISGFAFSNFVGNNAGATTSIQNGVNGNIVSTANPLLGPVVNAGGPTLTRPLTTGSPAINKVASGTTMDARGVARPVGASRDMGAFEGACTLNNTQLVTNASFETNTSGWNASFGATIATSTVYAQSGLRSLRITDRNQGTWQGAEYNLLGQAAAGDQLGVSLYARVEGDPSEPVLFTMRSTCSGASTVYTPLATGTATNTGWVALSGNGLVPNCTLTELVVYAEGPRTGVILHIDNVTVARQTVSCGTLPPASLLTGTFVSTSDTGGTYCVDLRVTNHTAVEQAWRATFAMNGARITSTSSNLTLDTTGKGVVRLVPNQSIPANTTQQGIYSVCASRTGGNALPSTPVIRTQY